jgi:hypothetical protein
LVTVKPEQHSEFVRINSKKSSPLGRHQGKNEAFKSNTIELDDIILEQTFNFSMSFPMSFLFVG